MKYYITEIGFVWEQIFYIFYLLHYKSKFIVELFHTLSIYSDIIINRFELHIKSFTNFFDNSLANSVWKVVQTKFKLLKPVI
jgi:hypothetical protein